MYDNCEDPLWNVADDETDMVFENTAEFDKLASEEDVLDCNIVLEWVALVVWLEDWRTDRVTDGEWLEDFVNLPVIVLYTEFDELTEGDLDILAELVVDAE